MPIAELFAKGKSQTLHLPKESSRKISTEKCAYINGIKLYLSSR